MSANNLILISKKSFRVWEQDADTGHKHLIGRGKNLEEAIEIAEEEMRTNIIEYGIHFID